ncbi:MAG: dihydrofolate reductase [Candidatus Taylorbacteria bacterium]|nr:dihydrofolate reductase [Candidatus Taylorbacteria bacterium]
MKTFIIAAVSADGFIAKDSNHPAFWTSKEDKKRFVELTRQAGIVIMGSQTYKTLPRALKERTNIVYSRTHQTLEGALVTQDDPHTLLAKLEAQGATEAAICGGSQIYSMFLKAQVVQKIYLTIEPLLFGKGISLFNEACNIHLELKSSETTPTGTLLLEYNVRYTGAPEVKHLP